MQDTLYLILGGCTAALTIWLIVRFVNRRSLAPVVIAAIPVLVLAVYVVRDELGPHLSRILPEYLCIGGFVSLLGSIALRQYLDVMRRVVASDIVCRWGNRLFGPQWASTLNEEFARHAVLTPTKIRNNVLGSIALIAAGAVWMAIR